MVESPDARNADAAVAQVLAIEQQALKAIADAREAGQQRVEDARAQAHALAERTERRLRRLLAAFEARTRAELAVIDAETAHWSISSVETAHDEVAVLHAVKRLAHEVIGSPA